MTGFIHKLKLKLGDFWWSSLILFLSCRVADVMNLFVGLYLVPKYIAPSELGAVLPLSSFAAFLALPASVFALTFAKELNSLAVRSEFGKMKSLMRGVFVATALFLILAVIVCGLAMPHFLSRIRIVKGSLGFLIIAAAFIGCVSPIYANALQALKRFRALSFMNLVCAPVRLVSMLLAMPFRPLSGYFVGQASTPAANIFISVLLLRKELSVKAERYWSRPIVRRFALIFLGMAGYQSAAMLLCLAEQTVLRERLPDVESAAYYMVTRFSDITALFSGTLLTVLFPFTAEAAERGSSTKPFVLKSSLVMAAGGGALALFFAVFGNRIVSVLPNGDAYAPFAWTIPWLIAINVISTIQCIHTNTESSAARFSFLKWWIPLNLTLAALVSFLPINSLTAMLWYFSFATAVKAIFAFYEIRHSE